MFTRIPVGNPIFTKSEYFVNHIYRAHKPWPNGDSGSFAHYGLSRHIWVHKVTMEFLSKEIIALL